MGFKIQLSLPEQISDYIGKKIISLEYKPGERIMETAIAEELGVSRSPIREALRILEKKRLVHLIPRRGASVTEITELFANNLFDILTSLLSLIAYKCIEYGTEEDFQNIQNATDQAIQFAQKNDPEAYFESVVNFALACLKATNNELLEEMIFDLMPCLQRVLYASFSIDGQDLTRNVEIVKTGTRYIMEKNQEMAAKTVCEYIASERDHAFKTETLLVKNPSG